MIVMFACQFAGLKITLVNPVYLDHELQHTLQLTTPKYVFIESQHLGKFQANKWDETTLIRMDEGTPETKQLHSVSALTDTEADVATAKAVQPVSLDEVAFLCFSSGTTGLPKAVQITHNNTACMMHTLNSIPGAWKFDPLKSVCFLPFFHAFGLQTGALLSTHNRGTMHLCTPFTPQKFVQIIETERVEMTGVSPPLVAALCTVPGLRPDQFKSLRFMISGGAALDAANQKRCMDRLQVPICQGWGMSELCVANCGIGFNQTYGSVGWLMPGVKARIVDEKMQDVPVGERGELLINSGTVMKGYYKNEAANQATFHEPGRWLRTGDLVTVDANGELWIIDRIKEVIKVGSYQVPPAELEGILKTHPKVRLAAVVGVQNKRDLTEMPRAYIELRPEVTDAHPELIKDIDHFLSSQTSDYKHLTGGIKIIPSVPVSATGKVVRKDIRKMAAEDPDLQ